MNTFAAVFAVISLALVGVAINLGTGAALASRRVPSVVVFGAAAVIFAWLAVRLVRVECVVGGTDLTVRNVFRTQTLDRAVVSGVVVRRFPFGRYGADMGLRIQILGATRELPISALHFMPKDKADQAASDLIDSLLAHPGRS